MRKNTGWPSKYYVALVAAAFFLPAGPVEGQFRNRGGRGYRPEQVVWGIPDIPGGFYVCRLMYTSVAYDPSGSNWAIEYPRGDVNFMARVEQLTPTRIGTWEDGRSDGFGHTVIRLDDPELFQCPYLVMASPGSAGFNDAEREALRSYLLKGGFLWADDFWGDEPWSHWMSEIGDVLPEYSVVELEPDHPLFNIVYEVPEVPQIPSLNRWRGEGVTQEFDGAEYSTPHARAIYDEHGEMLVLMTHNTDIADGFEREGDLYAYFETFSWKAYALGINVAIWAMTH
jgi:hypothetical protein